MALGARDTVTLFGRFRRAPRAEIVRQLNAVGASAIKDLTRATTLFVIGQGAVNLMPDGRLGRRLKEARDRGLPVIGEARLLAQLGGQDPIEGSIPAVSTAQVSNALLDVLNAFDVVRVSDGKIPFQDVDALKNAAKLEGNGLDPLDTLSALRRRRFAPLGRHQLTTDAQGDAVLQWDDGVTTLTGQGMLPLDEGDGLDALFETAMELELAGDLTAAARAFETCARTDKRDPIAPFNLGNVQRELGDLKAARLSYQSAIARDPQFAEAHFNLAGVLEESDAEAAAHHLREALVIDQTYAEAHYNLAHLAFKNDVRDEAEAHFRRFIALVPHGKRASIAAKALKIIELDKTA